MLKLVTIDVSPMIQVSLGLSNKVLIVKNFSRMLVLLSLLLQHLFKILFMLYCMQMHVLTIYFFFKFFLQRSSLFFLFNHQTSNIHLVCTWDSRKQLLIYPSQETHKRYIAIPIVINVHVYVENISI